MRRPLLTATLFALPVFGLLLFLGTWQVQRLAWKTDLLARIAASEAQPAVPLSAGPEPLLKVRVSGRFDHAREARLGLEVRGAVLGAQVVTPLLRDGADPILVNRGWAPLDGAPIARPEGPVTVEGWVHPGDRPGWFSATDDAAGRRFYTFDPPAIGAALGLPRVAPFGLVALGQGGGGFPDPARSLPRPTNNHLGYAITWYGLAVSLAAVLGTFALRRRKEADEQRRL